MFSKTQLNKYSDILIWGLKKARTNRFKKNDNILIRYDMSAVKLAEVLHARLLDMGMNPILRITSSAQMERNFFEKANNRQLIFQTPGEKELYENLNGGIYLHAPESLTHLRHIDPGRIGRTAVARKPLRDILWKREEDGHYGWTLCMIPTPDLAEKAGLSMKEYTGQVIKACLLDKKDPVKEWDNIFESAVLIKKWLNRMDVKYYHVVSDSIDLIITPGQKRRWIGISGHNIPSFELFISPDWRGTEGVYYADQPSFRDGNYVDGVKFTFKKGKVVKIDAKKGKDFVVKQLSIDEGANRVGEFSLTDRRFSKINKFMANTLYDENHGGRYGNCHIAVGMSYSDTFKGDPSKLTKELKDSLGFNNSALHWDLVNTEDKTVTAHLGSGKKIVIYENGIFTL
ncbi:MAG: aminopeptidase [Deltaproteobacteria bacterium]|nr:aminopeptidase [Deltaproteobacteria bacterium]